MEAQKSEAEKQATMASCRKKKNEEATFLEDLKDHIDEFVNASMDEHKTCFKKTIQKVLSFVFCFAPIVHLAKVQFSVYFFFFPDVWNVKNCS
ncbi:hypothetical protein J1N35_042600 [Gossypium stocksii]|uniref:Uncharacterized protein n=1 Tax=Gossypium stocksii TaxID=47602 RepID=A0A9D3ZEC4_9ROSI|nr:hypothetical protein J1N35_042600 [Gossypium stocksii]